MRQEKSERELLACCPFCGNDGSGPIERALHVCGDLSEWCVQCDVCTATMGFSKTREEAIEAWNTRAAGDAPAWQPIETAPADVQLLLGWWREWPILEWEMTAEQYSSTKGGWRHSWATHWMPLPAPLSRPQRGAESNALGDAS